MKLHLAHSLITVQGLEFRVEYIQESYKALLQTKLPSQDVDVVYGLKR